MRLTDPPGFPPAARIASSAACRSKPSSVPGHDDRLARQRAVERRRGARDRADRLHARVGEVVEDARGGRIGEPGAQARRDHRADAVHRLEALGRQSRELARHSGEPAVRALHRLVGSRAARRPRSSPPGRCAVCSPTWGMPSAYRIRPSGRTRDRSMAAARFSALLRAKRSSVMSCSTVSRKRSPRVRTMPRSSSWLEHGPAHALDVHAAAAHEVTELLADARRAREVGAVVADRALVLDHGGPADGAARRASRTRARCRHARP